MNLVRYLRNKQAGTVLVDIPNVTALGTPGVHRRIAWIRLARELKKKLGKQDFQHLRAYARRAGRPDVFDGWFARASESWAKENFILVVNENSEDDVDFYIGVEMLDFAAEAYRRGARKLHLLIVSGDSVFVHAYQKVLARYEHSMDIRLTICAWKNSLSEELASRAETVVYLDDLNIEMESKTR